MFKTRISIFLLAVSLIFAGLAACGAGGPQQPSQGSGNSGATLESITLTPVDPALAKNTDQQFVATGIYTDKSTRDLTKYLSWSSSDTATAEVDGPGHVKGKKAGSASIKASSGDINAVTTISVTDATLVSIAVSPTGGSIAKGTTQNFTAIGTFSDGTTQDLTASAVWTSSNQSVATLSGAAAVGLNAGTATITATSGSVSGSTTLTVTAATLVSIAVTPTNASISLGSNQQFVATGTFSDNTVQDLTEAVTWDSSSTGVATISNAAGSRGAAASAAVGSTTITAASGGISGSTTLTVTAATLVSIAVTPSNPSIAKGTSQQFAATGTYSDGSTQALTGSVAWESSNQAVATVSNAAGSQGLASSLAVGSITVTASTGGISGSTTLTVTSATLVSIAVTPSNPSIAKGTSQQFVATGTYSDGSTQTITNSVTWSSSNTGIATISNTTGSRGAAASVAVGSTTITATSGSISGSTGLTVTSATLVSIAVTPSNPSMAKGTSQQFAATGTYTDGSTQTLTNSATWSSSSTGVATVSNASGSKGLATSVAVGSTTITATSGSISGSTGLTVTSATLVSIAVTPSNPGITAGATQQFVATGTYTDGSTQTLTNSATWSSSSTGVATVSNASGSKGLATGVAAGSATITATAGSISGTATLSVTGTMALTLTWDAPTTYVDGSALSSLSAISSYRIYYGTSSLGYSKTADVSNPGLSVVSYTLNLAPGTYYFAVTAFDIAGQESSYSNEVAKTL